MQRGIRAAPAQPVGQKQGNGKLSRYHRSRRKTRSLAVSEAVFLEVKAEASSGAFRGSLSTNVPGMPGQGRAVADRSARRRTEDWGQALMFVKMGIFSGSPRQVKCENSHLRVMSPGLVVRRCRVWVLMLLEMIVARWHCFHNKTASAFCVIFGFGLYYQASKG